MVRSRQNSRSLVPASSGYMKPTQVDSRPLSARMASGQADVAWRSNAHCPSAANVRRSGPPFGAGRDSSMPI